MNAKHATQLIGQAALARMAMAGSDLAQLSQTLIQRAEADPEDAYALLDLASVLMIAGNRTLGLQIQRQALEMEQIYRLPIARKPAVRMLALLAPGDMMSNTPVEFLLENSDIELTLLYIGGDFPVPTTLPEHDLLFVAVGESEATRPLLRELQSILRNWPRPVLNAPAGIAQLSREDQFALLHDAPAISIPKTVRVSRDTLEKFGSFIRTPETVLGTGFPIIVRPVDSHAGMGLEKLTSPADIDTYLSELKHTEFFISRFVDYSDADGQFRKYRIALIAGQPYLAHLAISSHWMIHYANAGMADSAEKRAEEALAMHHFDREFARRHQAAFSAIHQRMGLDYLGIDCAETEDGKLLIFEVDTSMVVHAMDPTDIYPYKQPQMRKLFAAFRKLLLDTAKRAA